MLTLALTSVRGAPAGVPTVSSSQGNGGSVRYDAATHKSMPSTGCGKASPYTPGKTTAATGKYAGVSWKFRVYVPKSYDPKTPMPLILQHPGWGLTAMAEELGAGITSYADEYGFISVTPQGMNDNTHSGGPWYSWNVVGSTQSPGPQGATCTSAANHPTYCYDSCGKKRRRQGGEGAAAPFINETAHAAAGASYASYTSYTYGGGGGGSSDCTDSPQCWWTTCDETITPTGTGYSEVGGFLPGLYDTLESQLCIDVTREYASGESNGGMETYQLGVDLSHRLAAISPEFGSFHRGFAMLPKVGMPVLDLHGAADTTVPANVSLSADGYYYTTTHEIFHGTAQTPGGWMGVNGCKGAAVHWPTKWDGKDDFYCISEGDCPGGDVVRCMWNGGHNWLFNSARPNGGLVTKFLLGFAKTTHAGFGFTTSEAPGAGRPLEDVTIMSEAEAEAASPGVEAAFEALPRTLEPAEPAAPPHGAGDARKPHYGNPKHGCRSDEDEVPAGTGTVCALKVSSKAPAAPAGGAGQNRTSSALPEPQCKLGGAAPSINGCPVDAAVSPHSKAWPICLAKGTQRHETSPYATGDFHCLLVCPCIDGDADGCGAASHVHCPTGARCERGELRNRAQGVCTYHNEVS